MASHAITQAQQQHRFRGVREAQAQEEGYEEGLPQDDPEKASSCLTRQDDGTYGGNARACERIGMPYYRYGAMPMGYVPGPYGYPSQLTVRNDSYRYENPRVQAYH